MKVEFIEATFDEKVLLPKRVLDKLPKKIMFFMTAQLIPQKKELIKQLKKAGKKVSLTLPRHSIHEGQLLGCSIDKIEGDFEAFFYVGDGYFHPQALILKNDQPVHSYNYSTTKYSVLTHKDALLVRKRMIAAQTKFMLSKDIGVLVTTKQGQNKLMHFVKEKYPDKNFYFLVNNNVEFDRLEDFPFVECFVNTACERIAFDDYDKFTRPILNMEDLPSN